MLCKNCTHHKHRFYCTYPLKHRVYEPVYGCVRDRPLPVEIARNTEWYCGAKGKWFEEVPK